MSRPVVAFVPREVFSTTKRSLETLFERTAEPFDLVCVDGNSPPEVAAYLRQAAEEKGFALLRTDQYLTPNQARNLAATWAMENTDCEHIVFVDNDVLVSPSWLEALVRCAEETGAWVVGPAYYEHLPEETRLHMFGGECRIGTDDKGRRRYLEQHYLPHVPADRVEEELTRRETELIEFHTVLVSRAVFEQLGPLDEKLLCNAEHGDLCLTVRNAGHSVWLEPASKITYSPPRRLEESDREFFFLRWSEAWMRANRQRLQEKWSLDPIGEHEDNAVLWLRAHRRYGLQMPGLLKKWFGRKLGNSIAKRVVGPIDRMVNERCYPFAQHGVARPPRVEVFAPPAARAAA